MQIAHGLAPNWTVSNSSTTSSAATASPPGEAVSPIMTTPTPSQASGVEPASSFGKAVDTPPSIANPLFGDEWLLEQAREARVKQAVQVQQAQLDQEQIQVLAARDREVRAHEQAHVAVGGRYAGAPKYQYERGPDGVHYAVGGEVPISTSKEATPEETLIKAQIVRRAALAPAEPSPQDRTVAAQAMRMEAEARQEVAEAQGADAQADEHAEPNERAESDKHATALSVDSDESASARSTEHKSFMDYSARFVSSRSPAQSVGNTINQFA